MVRYYVREVVSRNDSDGVFYTLHAVDGSGKSAFSATVFQPMDGEPTVVSDPESRTVSDADIISLFKEWSALPESN